MYKINYRQASNQSEQLKSNKPCCCRTQQHCCCCWLWASYQQQPSWCRAVLLQSTVSSLQLCATYFSTRQSDNGWHIVNVAFVACRIWKVCWCLQSVCHSPAVVAVTKCMSYVICCRHVTDVCQCWTMLSSIRVKILTDRLGSLLNNHPLVNILCFVCFESKCFSFLLFSILSNFR